MAHLSRRFAPATLTNTEGEPLAICEATVRVGDPDGIEAALDETYDRVDGDEPPRWHEHVNTQGMPHIRAALVRDGDTLRVEANSAEADGSRAGHVGSARPRDERTRRRPTPDSRPARGRRAGGGIAAPGEDALDPDDPELAAILDEFIRDYEAKWLDEPIPALDGHTPRQAADDPTRRGDLIKLLDSFPAGEARPRRHERRAAALRTGFGVVGEALSSPQDGDGGPRTRAPRPK